MNTHDRSLVNLDLFEQEITAPPRPVVNFHIAEIARHIRALTYAEMLQFAKSLWAAKPEDTRITLAGLPKLLHRWAVKIGENAS
jgi:hypothetical protein